MSKTLLGAHLMGNSPSTNTRITLKQRLLASDTKARATWFCQPASSLCDATPLDLDWMALSKLRYACLHERQEFLTWLQVLTLMNLWIPDIFLGPFAMPTLPACKILHIKLGTQWMYNSRRKEPEIVLSFFPELGKYFPAVETLDVGNHTAPWNTEASESTGCGKTHAHNTSTSN